MLDEILMAKSVPNNIKYNLLGYKFGDNCVIIAYIGKDKHGFSLWLRQCRCGKEDKIITQSIIGKRASPCCKKCSNIKKSESKRQNLIGYMWNGCEVIGDYIKEKNREGKWKVRCRCGKEFYVKTSNIVNYPINGCRSCSQKENHKGKIENLTGQYFGKYKSKVIKMLDTRKFRSVEFLCICGNCGYEFITSAKRIREKTEPIHVCFRCAQKINKRYGKEHWNYKPELSEEERLLGKNRHLSEKYKNFHEKVLLRDNFKCTVCNSNNDLCVHHLDGFHWAKDKRLNIDNGITLCKKCHKDFHSKYTNFNNTKQQFKEFILTKDI